MKTYIRNGFALCLSALLVGSVADWGAFAEEPEEKGEKNETVYVFAGSDGSSEKVVVSDWLKNMDGSTVLNDISNLNDIENVKGYETFDAGKNGSLKWNADGSDIYYQGTSNEKAPVNVKITYTLDGKQMTAEEMAGKSGHAVIRFDYENTAKTTVTVDGKEREVTVPFGYMTGMVLPQGVFSNVKMTNGKVISDGENVMAAGVVFPGLEDSIGFDKLLDGKDLGKEIPDYIEVEADVENFELGMTMTVASSGLLNKVLNGEEIELPDLADKMDLLKDSANQLIDGTTKLHDGVVTLQEGTGTLSDGALTLRNGIQTLKDGTAELNSKSYDLDDGATRLDNGASDLKAGVSKVNDGAGALNDGAKKVADGANALAAGTQAVADGANQLVSGTSELGEGANKLQAGAEGVSQGAQNLASGIGTMKAGFDTAQEGSVSLLDGSAAVSNGLNQLNEAIQNAGGENSPAAQAGAALSGAITNAATIAGTYAAVAQGSAAQAGGDVDGAWGNLTAALTGEATTTNTYESEPSVTYGEPVVETTSETTYGAEVGTNPHTETFIVYRGESEPDENGVTHPITEEITVTVCDGTKNEEITTNTTNTTVNTTTEKTTTVEKTTGVDTEAVMNAARAYGAAMAGSQAGKQYGEEAAHMAEVYNAIAGDGGVASAANAVSQTTNAAMSALSQNAAALAAGANSVNNGINKIYQGATALQDGANSLAAGAGQVAQGSAGVADGVKKVQAGAGDLSAGAAQVNAGASALQSGAGELSEGTTTLKNGTGALLEGTNTLKDGTATLTAGTRAFIDGTKKLDDGAGELLDGGNRLYDGTVTLKDGVQQLLDGSEVLMDGMIRFDAEGIQKITELFGDDAEDVINNIKAVAEAGSQYQSFSGKADGTDGNVVFIIRTSEVKAD